MTLSEAMERMPPIWTVYDRPADYPDKVIVLIHYGEVRAPFIAVLESVDEARAIITMHGGCVNLGRQENDAPNIIESWI